MNKIAMASGEKDGRLTNLTENAFLGKRGMPSEPQRLPPSSVGFAATHWNFEGCET